MNANELRVLAEPKVEASFYTETDELIGTTDAPIKKVEVEYDGSIHVFIDHWPQADAQPVAVPAGWKLVPVNPTAEMVAAAEKQWMCGSNVDMAKREWAAMLAAAPAAPQAEPMADSDADYWMRNRQPILDAIERAGFMLMSNASGFWLHPRGKLAQAEPSAVIRCAYERAEQECIETAAELRRCADGCTDGRYDWKADGALDCADAIRALGGQHD